MEDDSKKERNDKAYLFTTIVGVFISALVFLFGNGILLQVKEDSDSKNCIYTDLKDAQMSNGEISIEPTNTVNNTPQNSIAFEEKSTTPSSPPPFYTECAKEGHKTVKTTEELNGFIYWNGQENYQRSFFHSETQNSTDADSSEPLHHVFLKLIDRKYIGMAISISRVGETGGIGMELSFNGDVLEFYISEGEYTISAEEWHGDYTIQYVKRNIAFDHCGEYIFP